MRIFDIDGPIIQFLSKMADLMWLNILTIVCCIPIITVGASLTALNYMALKIVRGEESYITKGFFKSFKENFKQSTVIWLLFLVVIAVLVADYRIVLTTDIQIGNVMKGLIVLVAAMTLFTFMFVFPVQAKFANTIRMTIWNAFIFSIAQFPKTVTMIVLYAVPYVLMYMYFGIFPIVIMFCFSLPAFLSAFLYNKFFQRLEDQILGRDGQADAEGIDGEATEAQEDAEGIDAKAVEAQEDAEDADREAVDGAADV